MHPPSATALLCSLMGEHVPAVESQLPAQWEKTWQKQRSFSLPNPLQGAHFTGYVTAREVTPFRRGLSPTVSDDAVVRGGFDAGSEKKAGV